jgi:cytochrome c
MAANKEVKFDLTKVTAGEMTAFFKANREQDFVTMAEIFASTCAACPEAWGNPREAKTFVDRPMFGGENSFKGLIKTFVEAISNTGE